MSDEAPTAGPAEISSPADRRRRGPWRTFVFPIVVIAAIAFAIWWLDYRPDGGDSPADGRYGPLALPETLAPPGADVAAKKGALAPDFLLQTLDGGDFRLSDYRGRPLVLNFWATWCAPCRKEIPQFVDAYDRFRDGGLVVVGVNLQESKGIVRDYADDFGMEFPIVMDRDGRVGERYRLLGLPMTFFIDRAGVVRSVFAGPFVEQSRGTNVQGAIASSELDQRIAEIME